jgi:hypothetical protein
MERTSLVLQRHPQDRGIPQLNPILEMATLVPPTFDGAFCAFTPLQSMTVN